MLALLPGLYLTVEQLGGPHAPQPLPLDNGFSRGTAYRALGLYSPSETSEAYFVLPNDRDEVWFISNRHLRAHAVFPDESALRLMALPAAPGDGVAEEPAPPSPG